MDSNNADHETIFSISNIMMKLPTRNLGNIRGRFQKKPDGLQLFEFVTTIIDNMDLAGYSDAVKVVADLIDFFHFVDVNGDGLLSWEEFVSFIVDRVVLQKDMSENENLSLVSSPQIQDPSARKIVRCVTMIKELNKLFLGIGEAIQVYECSNTSLSSPAASTWTNLAAQIPLQKRVIKDQGYGRIIDSDEAVEVIDISFSRACDLICILRSDICFEFFRLSSHTKISHETITPAGLQPLEQSYDHVVCRNLPGEQGMILAAGKSPDISVWSVSLTLSGQASLEEKPPLKKHTDFVRDILVIDTEPYSLLASCAMDRKIFLWDLESLTFKSNRSGHNAGAQSLGFDGVSILLAGGFDHTILGWDLNAEIEKPKFKLSGHNYPIVKIIGLGWSHVCLSLDESGELRYWRVSNIDHDINDHLVDLVKCSDDHLRSFDIIPNISPSFDAKYEVMIVTAGRRQHVYKIVDLTPSLGPPVNVNYSELLQLIIVTHVRDITFWSAITGELVMTAKKAVGTGEIYTSTIEKLGKKLVIAEERGVISVFNPLDGKLLRKFRQIPSTIKFMVYSPDRCVITVSSLGDIFVVNESLTEQDTDSYLRHAILPETEVIGFAYSHELSLFATVDNAGLLVIWDYQFMSIEFTVENSVGLNATPTALYFLDSYPLLFIADNTGNFTIIVVGPAAKHRKELIWKIKSVIHGDESIHKIHSDRPQTSHSDTTPDTEPFRVGFAEEVSSKRGSNGGEQDMGATWHSTSSNNNNICATTVSSLSSVSEKVIMKDGVDEELLGQHEGRAKPFDRQRMLKYHAYRRNVKCITAHSRELSAEDLESAQAKSWQMHSHKARKSRSEKVGGAAEGASLASTEESNTENFDTKTQGPSDKGLIHGGTMSSTEFPLNVGVTVICGHDDGTIACFDMTDALRKINVGPIQPHDILPLQPGYNGHRKLKKRISEVELERHISKRRALTQRKRMAETRIACVWAPHAAAVQNIIVMGNESNLLTSSDDGTVQLWTIQAKLVGILTRGSEYDRIFKRPWKSPVDVDAVAAARLAVAERMYKATTRPIATNQRRSVFTRTSHHEKQQSTAPQPSSETIQAVLPAGQLEGLNDIEKAIGQVHGRKTYTLSSHEIAELTVAKKGEKVIKSIHNISKTKKKRRRKKKSNVETAQSLDTLTDLDYYETLNYNPTVLKPIELRARHSTNRFQNEIANMLAAAPDNWGVASINTQRKLYQNLYQEKAKTGLDTNQLKVMKAKLDALSPDGDFEGFAETIKRGEGMHRFGLTAQDMRASRGRLGFSSTASFYNFNGSGRMERLQVAMTPQEERDWEEGKLDYMEVLDRLDDQRQSPQSIENRHNSDIEDDGGDGDDINDGDGEGVEERGRKEGILVQEDSYEDGYGGDDNDGDGESSDASDAGDGDEERVVREDQANYRNDLQRTASQEKTRVETVATLADGTSADQEMTQSPQKPDRSPQAVLKSIQTNQALRLSAPAVVMRAENGPPKPVIVNIKEPQLWHKPVIASKPLIPMDDEYSKNSASAKSQLSKSLSSLASTISGNTSGTTASKSRRRSKSKFKSRLHREIEENSKEIVLLRRESLASIGLSDKDIRFQPVEPRWRKKVNFINREQLKRLIVPENPNRMRRTSSFYSHTNVVSSASVTERRSSHVVSDEELIMRTMFGPYRASDMVKAMLVFVSLPAYDPNTKKEDWEDRIILGSNSYNNNNNNSNNNGTEDSKRVELQDFIMSDFIQSRPHFEQQLQKVLKKRSSKMNSSGLEIAMTLPELVSAMCPMMSSMDTLDCLQYLEMQKKIQVVDEEPPPEEVISEEKIVQLRKMFNFFDKNRTGRVNEQEIMKLMETESDKFYAKQKEDILHGGVAEEETRIGEASVRKMMSTVDLKIQNELDFDEFVQLFKDVI